MAQPFTSLFSELEPPLPREIEELEVLPKLPPPYLFVLSKVNRHFHDRFSGIPQPTSPLDAFALDGFVALVRWDQSNPAKSPLTPTTFRQAARGGSIAVLQELCDRNCPSDAKVHREAAMRGDLGVIEFLIRKGIPVKDDHAFLAARHGLAALQLYTNAGAKVNHHTLISAAESGDKTAIEFLLEVLQGVVDLKAIPKFLPALAHKGDLNLIEWARQRGAQLGDPSIYVVAASHGYVNILDFAKESSVPFSATTMLEAVDKAMENGQVASLRWLLEHNNVRPVRTAWIRAISHNHYDLLKFGLSTGLVELLPLHYTAAIGVDHRILQLLEQFHCPSDQTSLAKAIQLRRFDVTARLRKKGIEWSQECLEAALLCGDPSFLRSLVAEGREIPRTSLDFAIKNGASFATLVYLENELKFGYDDDDAVRAILYANLPETYRFLLQSPTFRITPESTNRFPAWWARPHVARLFLSKGIALDAIYAENAASSFNIGLLSFLERLDCPMNIPVMRRRVETTVTLDDYQLSRRRSTLKWLDEYERKRSGGFLQRLGFGTSSENPSAASGAISPASPEASDSPGLFSSISTAISGFWK